MTEQKFEVKYWRQWEPLRSYETCLNQRAAQEFAALREAEGFLTIVRPVYDTVDDDTIPRRIVRAIVQGLKEKLDE